jgi:hypothetical protein
MNVMNCDTGGLEPKASVWLVAHARSLKLVAYKIDVLLFSATGAYHHIVIIIIIIIISIISSR